MPVIGVSLTKLNAEKKLAAAGAVNVSNNVEITDVKETDVSFGQSPEKGLRFSFKFSSTYDPDAGFINIEGDIFYTDTRKNREIVNSWKKDKKIDQELLTELLNIVLRRCSIEALIMSKELMLPSPIPMPIFKKE